MARRLDFLDPRNLTESVKYQSHLKVIISFLVQFNRLPADDADEILCQYHEYADYIIETPDEIFISFDPEIMVVLILLQQKSLTTSKRLMTGCLYHEFRKSTMHKTAINLNAWAAEISGTLGVLSGFFCSTVVCNCLAVSSVLRPIEL